MKLLPYEQGYLDGLCGIYSIVNATRLILGDMQEAEAMKLFGDCMRHVQKRKKLAKVCTDGVSANDVWSILRNVVMLKYAIQAERPFPKKWKYPINDYFAKLQDYFDQDKKRTVIISIDHAEWDHWTVIHSLTPKQLILFDSALMKTINIARCTIDNVDKRKPYLIHVADTFFLYEK